MKSKKTTIMLAVFLGGIGAHRFYLGQGVLGLVYLLFGAISGLSILLGWIDAVRFALMSDEEFSLTFNRALPPPMPSLGMGLSESQVEEARAEEVHAILKGDKRPMQVEAIARKLQWTEGAVVSGLNYLVKRGMVTEDYDFDHGAYVYTYKCDELGLDEFDYRSMSIEERAALERRKEQS